MRFPEAFDEGWALAARLRARDVSSRELVEAAIARAEQVDADLNPFAVPLFERALDEADRADAALAAGAGGPLCGVPVTIKDSQQLSGTTAATGATPLADVVSTATSASVERVIASGAVILGKTTTPEFCYIGVTDSPLNGVTRNPWNLDRVTGGSSGGAAVAVAARIAPLSLAGDGGGSIRIPAAFCGVVGMKPTHGLVPREPCGAGWKTIAAYGPIATTVRDARTMLRTLVGFDRRDRYSLPAPDDLESAGPPARLRLAYSADLGHAALDADATAAFADLLVRLEADGVELVEDDPGLPPSIETWSTIAYSDSAVAERELLAEHRDALDPTSVAIIEFGATFTPAQIVEANHERERIHAAYVELFARTGADAFLTPTLGCEAFPQGRRWPERIGDRSLELPYVDWAPFLADANLTGMPACSVPIGLGDRGLPLAVQLTAPRLADAQVLWAAERVEAVSEALGAPPEPFLRDPARPDADGSH